MKLLFQHLNRVCRFMTGGVDSARAAGPNAKKVLSMSREMTHDTPRRGEEIRRRWGTTCCWNRSIDEINTDPCCGALDAPFDSNTFPRLQWFCFTAIEKNAARDIRDSGESSDSSVLGQLAKLGKSKKRDAALQNPIEILVRGWRSQRRSSCAVGWAGLLWLRLQHGGVGRSPRGSRVRTIMQAIPATYARQRKVLSPRVSSSSLLRNPWTPWLFKFSWNEIYRQCHQRSRLSDKPVWSFTLQHRSSSQNRNFRSGCRKSMLPQTCPNSP